MQHRSRWVPLLLVFVSILSVLVAACESNDDEFDESGDKMAGCPTDGGADSDAGTPTDYSPGRFTWNQTIQALVADKCGACHLGKRFGFASLERVGATFSSLETE